MFSRLLLPLDGSAHSEMALESARRLCQAVPARVLLVHVVPTFEEHPSLEEALQGVVQRLEASGEALLEQSAERMATGTTRVSTRLLRGNAVEQILNVATEWRADLIMVGSRGISPSDRYALGTVSFRVALLAQVSVFIAREVCTFRQILVPLDRSVAAARAAAWAGDLAARMDSEVSLLFVISGDPLTVKFTVSRGIADPFLSRTEKALAERKVRPRRMVEYGDPPTEIVTQAQEGGFDLVVMGAKGVRDSSIFTLGGVTMRVIQRAPTSVAIIRG